MSMPVLAQLVTELVGAPERTVLARITPLAMKPCVGEFIRGHGITSLVPVTRVAYRTERHGGPEDVTLYLKVEPENIKGESFEDKVRTLQAAGWRILDLK